MISTFRRAWNSFRQLGKYQPVVRMGTASYQTARFLQSIATIVLWFALFGGVFLIYVMAPPLLLAVVPLIIVGYVVIRRLFSKPT